MTSERNLDSEFHGDRKGGLSRSLCSIADMIVAAQKSTNEKPTFGFHELSIELIEQRQYFY